jgi:hypothetical protein
MQANIEGTAKVLPEKLFRGGTVQGSVNEYDSQ